jgi:hypothetical protein
MKEELEDLHALLSFTVSDYLFGIFKLFFHLRILITPLVSSGSSFIYGF